MAGGIYQQKHGRVPENYMIPYAPRGMKSNKLIEDSNASTSDASHSNIHSSRSHALVPLYPQAP
jgi:hypothetical protein